MPQQLLQIPFLSLDTKSETTRLAPGILTLAENCSGQIPGLYEKRNGYTALSAGPSSIVRLLSNDSELLAFDGKSLWSYSTQTNTAANVGPIAEALALEREVRVTSEATQVKYGARCTVGNVTVHAWIEEGTNPVFVMVQLRDQNGVVLLTKLVDSSLVSSAEVHAAAAGNRVLVVWSGAAAQIISYVIVDTVAHTVSTTSTFKNGANVYVTTAAFDLVPLSSTDVVIVWAGNVPNIRASRLTLGAAVVTEAATAIISGETPTDCIAAVVTQNESGYCLYYSAAAGGMRACCFNALTMAQTVAPFAVEAVVANRDKATLVRFDATHALAVWTRSSTATRSPFIQFATIQSNGTVGVVGGPLNNVGVASKAWAFNGEFYVNVLAAYTAQFTYFTVRLQPLAATVPWGFVAAMHAYRTAHNPAGYAVLHVPDVDAVGNVFWSNMPLDVKLLSLNSVTPAIRSYGADFADPTRLLGIEIGGAAVTASGACSSYDGQLVAEAGFLLYPEIRSAIAAAGAGMDNGTRTYSVIYEWTNRHGDTTRSTTAIFTNVTCANGATNNRITVKGDHIAMSRVGTANTDPTIPQGIVAIYRSTSVDASVLYRITSFAMDMFTATWSFTDTAQDASITSSQVLYTSGGVLDREPPLPATQLVLHQNRVCGISSADRKLLFYSAQYGPGETPWFSSIFQVRVDVGGDITAIASMDSHLLVFKEDRVFTIDGDGANALGQNSQLSPPQLVTGDCGCVDPRSVITMPDGVMFKSNKGVYVITRGLQLSYLGEPADLYWTSYASVVSANMLPDRREVRFEVSGPVPPLATPAGQKIVFNYQAGQWTSHRNYTDVAAVDARVINGVYCWATAAGAIYQESATLFLDPGNTYIPMTFETGWISPAGVQGFCRASRVLFLGQWKTDHGFELQIAKDFSDVYTESSQWSRTTLNVLPTEQVAYHVHQQKGESFRFRVSDYADSGSPGEGYAARGLAILAAPIRGSFEKLLPAAGRQ